MSTVAIRRGNPWIFKEINQYLEKTKKIFPQTHLRDANVSEQLKNHLRILW